MAYNIKEESVSLMSNPLLLGIKKNKYIVGASAFLVVALIVVSVIIFHIARSHEMYEEYVVNTEKADENEFAMRFWHYTDFAMSGTHVSIKLDWKEREEVLGEKEKKITISAKVYPINIKSDVKWSSDNEDIAKIDENGEITLLSPGLANITAKLSDNRYNAHNTAELTVAQPVTSIFLPVTNLVLYTGSTGEALEYRIYPENATNRNVTWSIKDSKVATIDNTGHIRPVSVGMTEATVTTEDGKKTARCFVTVTNYSVKVSEVTIHNENKIDSYLRVGETMNIVASVLPANAKNKTLQWKSEDEKIAAVDQSGKVTAKTVGKTHINVSAVNGINDVLTLTVQPSGTKDALDLNGSSSSVTNGEITYVSYDRTLDSLVDLQMTLDPPPKYDGATKIASREQTYEAMNPLSYCTGAYKYQFLDLSHSNNVDVDRLNSYLSDKGVLHGHAADFIAAAREYNVSEIYLVAHSCLETGNGTSTLSKGVEVNGVTVYNMFGIGAYDNSAVYSGSQKAYKSGWTDVSTAIRGGAQWISEYYINASEGRQNTLYKMLWNPENPGQHQYATDIEWATYQAVSIERIFSMFPDAVKTYEVPVYSGSSAAYLN